MSELTEILDRFNRKERNLLIRDALGHSLDKPLLLNDGFRERVGTALGGLEIPKDAWWATDYHLNWIAGALSVWRGGEQAIGAEQKNAQSEDPPGRWLIERNQEDADLLIAFDTTLILVEVKAFGGFTNKQIGSKIHRWRLLVSQLKLEKRDMAFHFVLMSRIKPNRLDPPPTDLLRGASEWPHAKLNVLAPLEKLKVTGKKPGIGAPTPNRETWFIVPVPPDDDEDDEGGELAGPI